MEVLAKAKPTQWYCILNFFVLFTMYAVQGMPFGLQDKYIPLHYRNAGMDYTQLSFLRLAYLPWVLKIVMAPFVDRMRRKYICIAVCLMIIACCYFYMSIIDVGNFSNLMLYFVISNFFLVLHDVTMDAIVMDSLEMEDLGIGNLMQIVGYKIGMILGGGVFGIVAQKWDIETVFCLVSMIQLGAGVVAIVFFTIDSQSDNIKSPRSAASKDTVATDASSVNEMTCLEEEELRLRNLSCSENPRKILSLSEAYCDIRDAGFPYNWVHSEQELSLADMFLVQGTLWTVIFIFVYKLGETGMMTFFPMFLMDSGMSKKTVHWWSNIAGHMFSILGSIVGGFFSSNSFIVHRNMLIFSVVRSVIMFGILIFVLKTDDGIDEVENSFTCSIAFVLLLLMSFVSGFLTTTTFTHMMHVSKGVPSQNRAFHYSLLSVIELLGKLSMTIGMGPAFEWLGDDASFTTYFALSLLPFGLFVSFPKSMGKLIVGSQSEEIQRLVKIYKDE